MKPYDTSGMLENQDELESALRDYFQQEMPPELQELAELSDEEFEKHYQSLRASESRRDKPFEQTAPRRAFHRGLLLSVLSFCLVLGFAWTHFRTPSETPVAVIQPRITEQPVAPEAEDATSAPRLEDSETLIVLDHGEIPLEMTPEVNDNVHESIDITLYNTEMGPVEQRTELSWTNITVENPETGSHVKMSMPEFTIDFVPVSKSSLSLIGDETEENEFQQ